MRENLGPILTFTAMMVTIMVLSGMLKGCTQLGKDDVATRVVDIHMRSTADECILKVKADALKEVSDDTIELKHLGD